MLRSLDLFSGVGGITQALDGICTPVAYCENDVLCNTILETKMKRKIIPRAPIFQDVKTLSGSHLQRKIDIIVGGWPCQDLSTIGQHAGLQGNRSKLIFEVLRLTDELDPPMLFLENVPPVLLHGFDEILAEFVTKRGYVLRWAIIPASSLGAPHSRKRWYGLFYKASLIGNKKWNMTNYKLFSWQKENAPRMIVPKDLNTKKMLLAYTGRLGNSVVPDAVRAAFMVLASGFKYVPTDMRTLKQLRFNHDVVIPMKARKEGARYATWGVAEKERVYKMKPPKMMRPTLDLTFDPRLFKRRHLDKVKEQDIIRKRVRARAWSTPRFTVPMCNVLTRRSVRDLPTQLRYEIKTPNHLRPGIINPGFVEWLMGFKPLKRQP